MTKVKKALIASFVLRIVAAALSFGVSVLLARLLGPAEYGLYAATIAIVMLLAIPSEFGIGTVLVKYVSAYQKINSLASLRALLSWAGGTVAKSSIAIALVAAIFSLFFSLPNSYEEKKVLLICLIALPIYALGEMRAAALRGLRRSVLGQLPEAIIRPALVLGSVIFVDFIVAPKSIDASIVAGCFIFASMIAFLIGAYFLKRSLPKFNNQNKGLAEKNEWIRSAIVLSFTKGGRVIINRIDLVFVAILAGNVEAGIYKVAASLSILIAFGLNAINNVIGPHFSRAYVAEDYRRLRSLFSKTSVASLLMALPIFLGLYFYGEELLLVFYGEDFSNAYPVLLVLAVAQLVNASAGPAGLLANMTGNEKWVMTVTISILVISVPLHFMMIQRYEAIGGAIVVLLSMIGIRLLIGWKIIRFLRAL